MRIIGGEYGGRKITPPANMPHTRPTTDIAREGLFNILQNNLDIPKLKTLDLFGGTGCISYELASRGATDLTIVEKDPLMHAFITETATKFPGHSFYVVRMEVFSFLRQCADSFDFVFAGPPYALKSIDELPEAVCSGGLLREGGWFVLEHTPRNDYADFPFFRAARSYGTTIFSIFTRRSEAQ